MPDLALVWDTDNNDGDFLIVGNDLAFDETIVTPTLYALFLDARVDDAERQPWMVSPGGYWGDAFGKQADVTGSYLWTLSQKATNEELANARDFCLEALQRDVVSLGLATSFEVEPEFIVDPASGDRMLALPVVYTGAVQVPGSYQFQPTAIRQQSDTKVFFRDASESLIISVEW